MVDRGQRWCDSTPGGGSAFPLPGLARPRSFLMALIVRVRFGAIAATLHRAPPSPPRGRPIDEEPPAALPSAPAHLGEVGRCQEADDEPEQTSQRIRELGFSPCMPSHVP